MKVICVQGVVESVNMGAAALTERGEESEPETSVSGCPGEAFREGAASTEDHVGFGYVEVTYELVKSNSMEG